MGPGGELRLGIGVIVISGIKQNCIVPIMNNKSFQKKNEMSKIMYFKELNEMCEYFRNITSIAIRNYE